MDATMQATGTVATTPAPASTTQPQWTAPAAAAAPAAQDGAMATASVPSTTSPNAATPAAAAGAGAAPVAGAAQASGAKSTTGVTFPVRPATTTATQAASPAVGHASAADAGSIGGALFSLVLVVGLILALGWLAKRMPGLQRSAGATGLRVVASVTLGPRDRAVVVDVGGTQLLLGVGQGGVRALHTLESPLPVADAAAPTPFAQILAQHFGKKP